jgi:cobalt-zinc-cadmium resistance protein CzcA
MIERILALSIRGRWLVAFLTLIVAGFGLWQMTKLPIDAVPDITNRQVQVNTFNPTLGPVDMESRSLTRLRRRLPASPVSR